MRIIDFHAHAFPDNVAPKAMEALQSECEAKAVLDGTLASLLDSMDRAGVDIAVLSSIATKVKQFEPILDWSREIASDRIIPFASFHPDDPEAGPRIRRIAESGLKGIKMHPYYQGFKIDEDRMMPLYRAIEQAGLLLLMHTGFDIAFERRRCADPVRTARVLEAVPGLKMVTSHMGGWEDYEEVEKHLLGKPVYIDLSYSVHFLPLERSRELVSAHPSEYLIFGTDSPWAGHQETLDYLRALGMGEDWERNVFGGNAARLLGLD